MCTRSQFLSNGFFASSMLPLDFSHFGRSKGERGGRDKTEQNDGAEATFNRRRLMPSPSPEIVQILSAFAVVFTTPTFGKALTLVYGTILGNGRRTVTGALRAMGQAEGQAYGTYHRVLNRAVWSPRELSRILLAVLIQAVPGG